MTQPPADAAHALVALIAKWRAGHLSNPTFRYCADELEAALREGRAAPICIACHKGDHQQCLGGACACIHDPREGQVAAPVVPTKCPRCKERDSATGPDTYCDVCMKRITKNVKLAGEAALPARPGELKRRDTPEAAAFWAHVERTAREWREQCPDWAREQHGLPPKPAASPGDAALRARLEQLKVAVLNLQTPPRPEYTACSDGKPCWCGYNVGMGPTHTRECLQVRDALSALSGPKET